MDHTRKKLVRLARRHSVSSFVSLQHGDGVLGGLERGHVSMWSRFSASIYEEGYFGAWQPLQGSGYGPGTELTVRFKLNGLD